MGMPWRGGGWMARPMPGVRPGGRPTSLGAQRSRQENRPGETAHPAGGCPALLEQRGPRKTPFATLRSNSCAESVHEARCARASLFCAARRFLRGGSETAEQPAAKRDRRLAPAVQHTPLLNRREAQEPGARAQRASTTGFAPLCLSAVSTANEASWARPRASSIAGNPAAKQRGGFAGATLCLLSGRSESRSPAGANSRLGRADNTAHHNAP